MDQRSKIAILGYGLEGKSIYKYLKRHKYYDICICDKNPDLDIDLEDGISVQLGKNYLEDLEKFDVIFRSPGIRVLNPLIQTAILAGKKVTSSTALFLDQAPCPVIGVTGTNGKGTTSSLIYEMLKKKYGDDVYLAGNIGVPALDLIDDLTPQSKVILELSSFQLQDLEKSPHYAVFLNTSSDHLDYHADQEEYMKAKERILTNQNDNNLAILNKDYDYYNFYRPFVKGRLYELSTKDKVKNGAYVKDGKFYFVRNSKSEEIADVNNMKLIGSHNLENVLAAIACSKDLNVENEDIKTIIASFKGLKYRLEHIREINGINFYNDSISTTPYTSMAAVDSFESDTILIAGGYEKGADYHDWARKILTRINLKTVVLCGATSEKMENALIEAEKELGEAEGSATKIIKRNDFKDAVLSAYMEAKKGDVVVLSPAAASFDMFKNYKERGKAFEEQVLSLE